MASDALIAQLTLGGRTVTVGNGVYRLLSSGLDGVDAPETALSFAEAAQLDGCSLISAKVPGREITLKFEIADYAERERYRRELLSFFAPKSTGTLSVTRYGVTRSIDCMLSGQVSFLQETLSHYIRVTVPLFCPDPYFYGAPQTAELIHGSVSNLYFPLTLTALSGFTPGWEIQGSRISVDNTGDTDIGFVFSMTAAAGAQIVSPCITLGNNAAHLRVLTTLSGGDILTVSTLSGSKYIRKNGAGCMFFDSGSTFFGLPCGTNTLHISSASASYGTFDAAVSYRLCYFGV